MASASEIESYKGDSALAGGYGAQGTQNVISSVWKMTDAINESFGLLKAQQFKKNRDEYDQRIKDRDELAKMIESDQLNVDKLSDEDRLNANAKIQELRNTLIDAAKNGKVSDDKSFLEIKKKYAEIKSGINNKNVNNIAQEADRVKYENQYDDGYEKHQAKEKELMAKDENHKYQPYVPVLKYDDKKVFAPLITDKKEEQVGKYQVKVTETPNLAKTIDDTGKLYVTPEGRKQIMAAYDQLKNGGNISVELIENANKKLEEIALTLPEDQRAFLKPIDMAIDSPAMVVAKQRIAMGYGNVDMKPKTIFPDEARAKAWADQQQTEGNIQQNEATAKNARDLAILNSRLNKEEKRLEASLENSKKEFEKKLDVKYGTKDALTKAEKEAGSKLMVQTYNAIKKEIEENENYDDDKKILELQRLKDALDNDTEYKSLEEEEASPGIMTGWWTDRYEESKNPKKVNKSTNKSSNVITTKSGIVIENVE